MLNVEILPGINIAFESNLTATLINCSNAVGDIRIPRSYKYENDEYNITTIGENSFKGAKTLSKLSFSENSAVVTIEKNAFQDCSISHLSLPPKLQYLDEGWCSGIRYLSEIRVPEISHPKFQVIDDKYLIGSTLITKNFFCNFVTGNCLTGNFLYGKDGLINKFNELFFARRDIIEAEIPQNIRIINSFAFQNCNKLKFLSFLGKDIEEIRREAFEGCTNLSNPITFPSSLEKVGYAAFRNNEKLKALTFQSDKIIFESYCFEGCTNLKIIETNASKIVIKQFAFDDDESITLFHKKNAKITGQEYFKGRITEKSSISMRAVGHTQSEPLYNKRILKGANNHLLPEHYSEKKDRYIKHIQEILLKNKIDFPSFDAFESDIGSSLSTNNNISNNENTQCNNISPSINGNNDRDPQSIRNSPVINDNNNNNRNSQNINNTPDINNKLNVKDNKNTQCNNNSPVIDDNNNKNIQNDNKTPAINNENNNKASDGINKDKDEDEKKKEEVDKEEDEKEKEKGDKDEDEKKKEKGDKDEDEKKKEKGDEDEKKKEKGDKDEDEKKKEKGDKDKIEKDSKNETGSMVNQSNDQSNYIITNDEEINYKPIGKISQTETYCIWKVVDIRTNQKLSKLFLNPSEDLKTNGVPYAMVREFEFLRLINHPCICKAYLIDTYDHYNFSSDDISDQESDRTFSFYFECMPQRLRYILDDNLKIDNTIKTKIAIEILSGMIYLQKLGINHDGLTIDNILLNEDFDTSKIMLFSIFDRHELEDDFYNKLENFDLQHSQESYAYSFGMILYELFTNSKFEDYQKENDLEPSESISRLCIDLIKKCLSPDTSIRPKLELIFLTICQASFNLAEGVNVDLIDQRYSEIRNFEKRNPPTPIKDSQKI